jgi:transposase
MDRGDLQHLSKEQLIELVLQLQRPDKNSRTSSKPPSTDKKEKRENSRPGGAKLGHEPHNRRLADDPDEFFDHMPGACEQCGGAFPSDAAMELIGEYDEIEIPPVKPHVIRHRRFACQCAHCGLEAKAPAPAVATTTPFGPRIHALAIYLKGFQALSYERLRGLFHDAFGLGVSEGALMNMFIRSHPRFKKEAEKAKAILRAAKVVASDETGVRIEGTNAYHWVFHCRGAVVHQPDYSRAARVVDEMMAGHKPAVWISDRYSAQQNHGERHQTCLAHLARDTAFAHEHGSDDLPLYFKLWLGRAFDLAKTIVDVAASTLGEEKTRVGKAAHGAAEGANPMRPGPRPASQDRARAGPTSDLLRLSGRGRRHEQHVGAHAPPMRDPTKSDQRLSRHVGRRGRSRCPHNRRHRKAQQRKPLRRDHRRLGLNAPRTASARLA